MKNSKTFKILLAISIVLLIVFTWVVVRDARDKRAAEAPVNTGIENPFGTDGGEQDLPGSGEEADDDGPFGGGNVFTPPVNNGGNIVIVEDNPVLKKLSDASVAGFTFVKEERIIETPDSVTPDSGIVEVYDFSGYKTIRFGDKADEIVAIKTVLNRQTPSPALIINNDYDTDMKNAVIEFQNKNGLTGDGVIGPKSYTKLNEFQGITTFTAAKKPDNIEIVDMVRYVDVASGIMFDKAIKKPEDKKSITKNSVPRVVEAMFDNTGTKAIMRYLTDNIIQTYLVSLTFQKIDPNLTKEERDAIPKTAEVSGEFLPENIESSGISKDGKNFFYMNPISGGVAGITYNFATKAKKEVYKTPFTEWIVDYAGESKINLTTKSSGLVAGYSYGIDTKTTAFSKNTGGQMGLTTLMSPDGKKILFAEYKNGNISTYILEIATQKINSVSPSAIPQKCVWTKASDKIYCAAAIKSASFVYPDDWYKGKISFEDALWMIDAGDFSGNIIYDIVSKSGERIDATSLRLDSSETYLGFINKKDGILWGYDLAR